MGPTAVGKTSVGIELAKRLGAEILSVDSRQVYKRLELGTAKPTAQERCAVAHHLIDLFEPTEQATAAEFARLYRQALGELTSRGKRGLAVGGSGLYVDACLGRLDAMPPASEAVRERHLRIRKEHGPEALHRALEAVDPAAARRLSPRDFQRVSRALEVFECAGVPLSALQRRRGPLDLTGGPQMILLLRDREQLNRRIEKRAHAMVAAGLPQEVERLLGEGVPARCPAFESIGYSEFARSLRREISLEEATEAFIQRTRRFAKRQITWFRNRYVGSVEILIPEGQPAEETAERAWSATA